MLFALHDRYEYELIFTWLFYNVDLDYDDYPNGLCFNQIMQKLIILKFNINIYYLICMRF